VVHMGQLLWRRAGAPLFCRVRFHNSFIYRRQQTSFQEPFAETEPMRMPAFRMSAGDLPLRNDEPPFPSIFWERAWVLGPLCG
jgi:hypothetical protein